MTKEAFHVLLSLADEDRHGYGIIQDVSAATGGALTLRTGTLYNIVKRLLEEGWIIETHDRPAPEDDDERRRYYAITPAGRRALEGEARRLEQMLDLARTRRIVAKPAKGGSR